MAIYACRVGTPSGEIITRRVEAIAEEDARQRLEREGYHVFALWREGGLTFAFRPRRGTLKIENFLHFNQQLAALVRAGLPILQAITLLTRRQKNAVLRAVLQDIEQRIREGTPLSQAFAAHGDLFPPLYVASVMAGEKAGTLDDVLLRYIAYTKQMVNVKRKIRSAATYPAFLLVVLVGLVSVMTGFVIPRVSLLYEDFGRELPVITQIVLSVSHRIKESLPWLLPSVIGGVAVLGAWRRTARGRLVVDGIVLRLPIVGPILRDLAVTQLARSLATLLQGGVTLVEAFRIASQTITNRVLAQPAGHVLRLIQEGQPVAESLERMGWMPPLAVDMVRVGERAGSLKEMLDELANFYDAELDVRLSQVTTLIQPVMLLIMAGLVTVVLLSIYLPLFSFVSTLGAR
jgi:type IV pilus assembly protein PilC